MKLKHFYLTAIISLAFSAIQAQIKEVEQDATKSTNIVSLSKYNIQKIVNDVFKKHIANSKNETILYFEKYVNMDRKAIINDILSYYWSWDLFSIGCLFYDILMPKYKQNLFLQMFLKLLLVCQNPIPNKRYTANQCLTNFQKIIDNINIGVFLNAVKM